MQPYAKEGVSVMRFYVMFTTFKHMSLMVEIC
jgi:hypothetical protein